MSDPKSAIALISSSADPKTFGTGFVVHQDEACSYLVTCAHVLRDIEKQNGAQIIAGGLAARVVARGEPDEVDLAIVAVPRWWDRSPLILATGTTGTAVCVWGHCSREEKSALLREEQRGQLAKAAQLTGRRSGEAVAAWYLSFGGGDRLEPGYSGGPVLCGDRVVAVAAIKLGEDRAIAIGIEALAAIWPEMPPGLLPEPLSAGNSQPQPPRLAIGVGDWPPIPSIWEGRAAIQTELAAKLAPSDPTRIITIIAPGGMGKSSLALKLLESVGLDLETATIAPSCPFASIGWFKADGEGFDRLFDRCVEWLGNESQTEVIAALEEQTDQLARWFAALVDQPRLFVLDNWESALYPANSPKPGRSRSVLVGQLLHGLANRHHRAKIILTTQQLPADLGSDAYEGIDPDPEFVHVCRLPGLTEQDGARVLQRRQLRDAAEDLQWIARAVGGNPLCLRQLASLAKNKPGYLRKNPRLVSQNLNKIVTVQFDRLSPAAQDLLLRMGLLRRGADLQGLTFLRLWSDEWEQDSGIQQAMQEQLERSQRFQMPETALETTAELLRLLQNNDLIDERYDAQSCEIFYSLHPAIAAVIRNRPIENCPILFSRVLDFYESGLADRSAKNPTELQLYGQVATFAFQLGDQQECEALGITLMRCMVQLMNAETLKQQILQADAITENQQQATALLGIGQMHYQLGNWNEADQLFQEALALAEVQGDKATIAAAWGQLGDIERNRGNWEAAERLYRQKLETCEELGDRQGMSQVIGTLGDIERNRGNWDAAECLYRQSLELRTELGDRAGMATSIGCLGENELGRGNLEAAEPLLRDALTRMENLGVIDKIAEANFDLALLEKKRGNLSAAEQHFHQAREIYQQLGAAKDLEHIETEWHQEP